MKKSLLDMRFIEKAWPDSFCWVKLSAPQGICCDPLTKAAYEVACEIGLARDGLVLIRDLERVAERLVAAFPEFAE